MQRKILAAAVFAFPLVAAAQSSVTIYGIADAAIAREDTGAPSGARTVVNSGNQSGSRIGFRGVEDLGNGLKAAFTLEAAVNMDTGTADTNTLFGRRAVVGLQGDFGSVMIGREYSPVADVAAAADITGQGLYGSNLNSFGTGRLTRRISNSVNYKSNVYSGFQVGLAYSAGEQNTGPSQNLKGISANYSANGFYVGGAYQTTERVAAGDDKEWIVGAGYKFGDFDVKASYARADGYGPANKFEQANLGASYALGANKFFVTLQQNKLEGGAKGNEWALGYTYALSKRTNLYAAYATMRNNNKATFGINSGATNVTPPSTALGADPKALSLGIRHLF
ncbi:MAG: porin [Gammaproteobacteria bacterium]